MMLEGCREGRHDECKRKLQASYFDKDKWVLLDAYYVCECTKRGCECFVKAADRGNSKKKKRKS